MTTTPVLPSLPEPAMRAAPVGQEAWPFPRVGYYTAEQMNEHARRAIESLSRAPAEPVAPDEFCWLVELFDLADNSLVFYHTGFTTLGGSSRTTRSPFEAKRYASKDAANLVASKLYSLAGVWKAAEHVFAAHPTESAGPATADYSEQLTKAKNLLTDWVNSFVDCIEGGEADPMVLATREFIAPGESHEG